MTTETKECVNEELTFSLIYSFDVECEWDETGTKPQRNAGIIESFMPPKELREKFSQTEGDEEFEFEAEVGPGMHRKFCAELTEEEFEEFLRHCSLYASGTKTMGALGMPGHGIYHVPAMCFDADRGVYCNAYVLPNLTEQQALWFERDWDKCEEYFTKKYGEDW